MSIKLSLPSSWSFLQFFSEDKMETIDAYYRNQEVYPPKQLLLRAFDTPFDEVECVILGQDPYHRKGQAHGLSFSVPAACKPLPPSLRRVFDEYEADLRLPRPRSGDLTAWSKSGKLLLNTALSVECGKPKSHQELWKGFAYEVLSALSSRRKGLVFLLWGAEAQQYRGLIDEANHKVVASDHPSPLAIGGRNPFRGSRPFSITCEYLGKSKDWWRLE